MSSNQKSSSSIGSNQSSNEYVGKAPYTAEEKQWVKGNFKSEFHMLRSYGQSIYKEDDREEGRAMVREFMKHDEK